MRKELKYKLITIVVVLILGIWFLKPSVEWYFMITPEQKEAMTDSKKRTKKKNVISLGLDLKGGMDLVLEVNRKEFETTIFKEAVHNLQKVITDKKIENIDIKIDEKKLRATILNKNEKDKIDEARRETGNAIGASGIFEIKSSDKTSEGIEVKIIGLKETAIDYKYKDAVKLALEILRNRVDKLGLSEPIIKKEGADRIRVQLPDVRNTEDARDIIGRTATLKFQLMDRVHDSMDMTIFGDMDKATQEIKYGVQDPKTGVTPVYLLRKKVLLTGTHLVKAGVSFQGNKPVVTMAFDSKGGEKFYIITKENVNNHVAIVLDDKVYSAPVIKSAIPGGQAIIESNSFTIEEARKLSIILQSGALPAEIKELETRIVGPSLGVDSIKRGRNSILWGFILVVIFMLFWYKFFGIIANFALFINLILVLSCLAFFNATLTLPGIAGIILTIGMAVDANVIIFERIKEELKHGKSIRSSIEGGFDKAFSTIFDANITTLITSLVLYSYGTGPIKGFAITLGIGIVASMFTALFMVKAILEVIVLNKNIKTLSI